jgi:hypothetical protein
MRKIMIMMPSKRRSASGSGEGPLLNVSEKELT